MEPFNLRCWKVNVAGEIEAIFYTCARPGRSLGPDVPVDDETVSTWVKGLPGPNTAIISLLGRKGGLRGVSEFTFYSFCGGIDGPSERKCQMTFLEWLEHYHKDLGIILREHPTIDRYAHRYHPIHPFRLARLAEDVLGLLSEDRTVVVMDSGGVGRTEEVCDFLNAVRGSQSR